MTQSASTDVDGIELLGEDSTDSEEEEGDEAEEEEEDDGWGEEEHAKFLEVSSQPNYVCIGFRVGVPVLVSDAMARTTAGSRGVWGFRGYVERMAADW